MTHWRFYCTSSISRFFWITGKLLLGEGATLEVKGEVAELIHGEEGGLVGLLRPSSADPVTISLNSDYFLHNLVVVVLPPLLPWHGEPRQVDVILPHHL